VIDFSSSIAKIARADCQIEDLRREMHSFCGKIKRSIKTNDEADEKQWTYWGENPIVPISWSVRTGEVLYNLRSALDHLVWQLVLANGQRPNRNNQFPIVNDASEWNNSCRRRLNGISDRSKQTIKHLQPFNPTLVLRTDSGVCPFDAQTFRILRELSNIDKHRYLHLIIVTTGGIGPIEFGENQPPRRTSDRPLTGKGQTGALKKGKVLFSIDDLQQPLSPEFRIQIKFESRQMPDLVVETVPNVLRRCLQAVRGAERLLRDRNGY